MNAFGKILLTFVAMCVALTFSVLVMIHGWGLEPKSWWWIIGVGMGLQIFARTLFEIGKLKD